MSTRKSKEGGFGVLGQQGCLLRLRRAGMASHDIIARSYRMQNLNFGIIMKIFSFLLIDQSSSVMDFTLRFVVDRFTHTQDCPFKDKLPSSDVEN